MDADTKRLTETAPGAAKIAENARKIVLLADKAVATAKRLDRIHAAKVNSRIGLIEVYVGLKDRQNGIDVGVLPKDVQMKILDLIVEWYKTETLGIFEDIEKLKELI